MLPLPLDLANRKPVLLAVQKVAVNVPTWFIDSILKFGSGKEQQDASPIHSELRNTYCFDTFLNFDTFLKYRNHASSHEAQDSFAQTINGLHVDLSILLRTFRFLYLYKCTFISQLISLFATFRLGHGNESEGERLEGSFHRREGEEARVVAVVAARFRGLLSDAKRLFFHIKGKSDA